MRLTELQQAAVDRCRGNLADFYRLSAGQRGDRAPEFCGVFSVNVEQLLDVIAELADDPEPVTYRGDHFRDIDGNIHQKERADDPPEYGPDGEAERIAEVFDEARAELDRGL